MKHALISPYAMPGIRSDDRPSRWRMEVVKEEPSKLSKLLKAICEFYDLEESAVLGKKRLRELVIARKIFALICGRYLRISCSRIGAFLNKDHTTILFYAKDLAGEMEENHILAQEFQILSAKVF